MQTKTPDSFCSLPLEVSQVGKIFKNQDFGKEKAGFTLTNYLTGLVENAIKEDILNRFVQPAHLPRSDGLRFLIKTIIYTG